MMSLKVTVFRVIWTTAVLCAVMSFVGEKLSGMLQDSPRPTVEFVLPAGVPDEANRVWAEEGFSLIAPAGWHTIPGEQQLLFVPEDRSACPSSLRVRLLEDRFRHPVPLPETRTFQGEPAYSVIRTAPSGPGEPARYELTLVIERSGECYELCYDVEGSSAPENVWEYFETFSVLPTRSISEL